MLMLSQDTKFFFKSIFKSSFKIEVINKTLKLEGFKGFCRETNI